MSSELHQRMKSNMPRTKDNEIIFPGMNIFLPIRYRVDAAKKFVYYQKQFRVSSVSQHGVSLRSFDTAGRFSNELFYDTSEITQNHAFAYEDRAINHVRKMNFDIWGEVDVDCVRKALTFFESDKVMSFVSLEKMQETFAELKEFLDNLKDVE